MQNQNPLRTMILPTSQKGGGGKSTWACTFVDVLRSEGIEIGVFDADSDVGSLSDMHSLRSPGGEILENQDPLRGVGRYNIRNESRDELINSLALNYPLMLHDLAGGSKDELARVFDDSDQISDLSEVCHQSNVKIIFVHLLTTDISTIASLASYLDLSERLEHPPCHLAVLNRNGLRSDEDFKDWHGYLAADGSRCGGNTKARLLKAGGMEMSLPNLAFSAMDRVKSIPLRFHQALAHPGVPFVDQKRIQIFLRDFRAQLTPEIRAFLGAGR